LVREIQYLPNNGCSSLIPDGTSKCLCASHYYLQPAFRNTHTAPRNAGVMEPRQWILVVLLVLHGSECGFCASRWTIAPWSLFSRWVSSSRWMSVSWRRLLLLVWCSVLLSQADSRYLCTCPAPMYLLVLFQLIKSSDATAWQVQAGVLATPMTQSILTAVRTRQAASRKKVRASCTCSSIVILLVGRYCCTHRLRRESIPCAAGHPPTACANSLTSKVCLTVLCLRATVLDTVSPIFTGAPAPTVPGQIEMRTGADAGAGGGGVTKAGGNVNDSQGQQMTHCKMLAAPSRRRFAQGGLVYGLCLLNA
jgi:hypothetical protein